MLHVDPQSKRNLNCPSIQQPYCILNLPPEILQIIFSYIFCTPLTNTTKDHQSNMRQRILSVLNIRSTCKTFHKIMETCIKTIAQEANRMESLGPGAFILSRTLFRFNTTPPVPINVLTISYMQAIICKLFEQYSQLHPNPEDLTYPQKATHILEKNFDTIHQLFCKEIPNFGKNGKLEVPTLLDTQSHSVKIALMNPMFFEELLANCSFIPDIMSKHIVAACGGDISDTPSPKLILFIDMLKRAASYLRFEVVHYMMKNCSQAKDLDALAYGNEHTWRLEILGAICKNARPNSYSQKFRTVIALYTNVKPDFIRRDRDLMQRDHLLLKEVENAQQSDNSQNRALAKKLLEESVIGMELLKAAIEVLS